MKRKSLMMTEAAGHARKIRNQASFTAVNRWTRGIHGRGIAVGATVNVSKITTTISTDQFI